MFYKALQAWLQHSAWIRREAWPPESRGKANNSATVITAQEVSGYPQQLVRSTIMKADSIPSQHHALAKPA